MTKTTSRTGAVSRWVVLVPLAALAFAVLGATTVSGAIQSRAAVAAKVSPAGLAEPGAPYCAGADWVSGGGLLKRSASSEDTFAVEAGIRRGAFWGRLAFHDHSPNGPTVKSQSVTAYTMLDANTRRIQGTASVNGQPGFTYQVEVSDRVEPGGADTFSLRLSNGYSASGALGGGNIKLHQR